MNRTFEEIYNNKNITLTICEETRDTVEPFVYTVADSNWKDAYNSINITDKLDYIKYILQFQFKFIQSEIEALKPEIKFHKVGRLYYKKSFKLYKDLIRDNPHKSKQEIADVVRQKHYQDNSVKYTKVKTFNTNNVHLNVAIPK